jgi:hypothetical protein
MVEMHAVIASLLMGVALLGGTARAADALPKRDLTVELRQTEDGHEEGGHYTAGSADSTTLCA